MVTEYQNNNVKTRRCKERRKVLGTEQYPEDSSKTVFPEEVLRLANHYSYLRINHTDEWGKIIIVCASEDSEHLLRSRTIFLDCAFENCRSRKHIAWEIAYPVLFAILLIKKKQHTIICYTLLKNWCSLWTPKIM